MDEYFEKNTQNMLLFEKYFKTQGRVFLLLLLFFINSCKKDSPEPPSITTTTITTFLQQLPFREELLQVMEELQYCLEVLPGAPMRIQP
jgi:hypothetical protein